VVVGQLSDESTEFSIQGRQPAPVPALGNQRPHHQHHRLTPPQARITIDPQPQTRTTDP